MQCMQLIYKNRPGPYMKLEYWAYVKLKYVRKLFLLTEIIQNIWKYAIMESSFKLTFIRMSVCVSTLMCPTSIYIIFTGKLVISPNTCNLLHLWQILFVLSSRSYSCYGYYCRMHSTFFVFHMELNKRILRITCKYITDLKNIKHLHSENKYDILVFHLSHLFTGLVLMRNPFVLYFLNSYEICI